LHESREKTHVFSKSGGPFRRAGGLITWREAHAEAGQDTLKRSSMASAEWFPCFVTLAV